MSEFSDEELAVARKAASRFPSQYREDCYWMALLSIWRRRDQWDQRVPYRKFLFTVAYYGIIDEVRLLLGRYRRELAVPIDWSETRSHPVTQYMLPEHEVVDMDTSVSHLVAGCTELEQRIAQRLAEGASKQQIAEELGVSPSRISQMLRPIKRHLQQVA